jgi:hypothetical protein
MPAVTTVDSLVRAYLATYEWKDRSALEPLLAAEFRFSSPVDDRIDRAMYFAKCWPGSTAIRQISVEKLFVDGTDAFVRYELRKNDGSAFRNVEFIRTEGKCIVEIQVYFGST